MAEVDSSPTFKCPPFSSLTSTLHDGSAPIAARTRAIFYLRTMGGAEAVSALCAALREKSGSVLFRHEVAYVLGQMQARAALPDLLSVLRDVHDDVIVRHEAAEALGAIADESTLADLDAFSGDASAEVAETCCIAARRVRWVLESGAPAGKEDANPFHSVDPAPSQRVIARDEVPAFAAALIDASLPLFERYKAMFSLRNAGSKAAVLALCAGFQDASPLFRHEVAYVLGQLAHAASIPALMARTRDEGEHDMVRHEAAEALGAIGTGECVDFLAAYDAEGVPLMLRESCQVARDVVDYWAQGEEAKEAS
jgi:deoxyhypusine monooxygenase